MPSRKITDRLAAGETLLLDGGTGSELQRRGADVLKGTTDRLGAWSATANIEFGDVVRVMPCDQSVQLVRTSKRTFYDSLRGKLHWGE